MSDTASLVFVSYSRRDMNVMYRVRDYLRDEGLTAWTDEALVPGTPQWEREIQNAIKDSGCIIVILSPNANESLWVNREISFADEFGKRIYPVLVSGTVQTSIPLRLINHQRTDIRKDENFDREMKKLVETVCQQLGVESVSAARARIQREEDERRKAEEEAERQRIIEEARKRHEEISQARKRREEEARLLAEQLENERRQEEEAQRELERLQAQKPATANLASTASVQEAPSRSMSTPSAEAVEVKQLSPSAVSTPAVQPKRELPPLPPLREPEPAPVPTEPDIALTGWRRFVPPNLLNILHVLLWWLVSPQRLSAFREEVGDTRFQTLTLWLSSMLIWLPVLVVSLPFFLYSGLANEYESSFFTLPGYMPLVVLAAWLLTAGLGSSKTLRWAGLVVAAVIGLIVTGNLGADWLVRGYPPEIWKPLGVLIILLLIAEMAAYGFSIVHAGELSWTVVAGVSGGMTGGSLTTFFNWSRAGFIGNLLVILFTVGIAYLFLRLPAFARQLLSTPPRAFVNIGLFVGYVIANILIAWLVLADGWSNIY